MRKTKVHIHEIGVGEIYIFFGGGGGAREEGGGNRRRKRTTTALVTSSAIPFVTVVFSTHPLPLSASSPTSSIVSSIVSAMTDPNAVHSSSYTFWAMVPISRGEYTCSTRP